jgi:hypothetical protein
MNKERLLKAESLLSQIGKHKCSQDEDEGKVDILSSFGSSNKPEHIHEKAEKVKELMTPITRKEGAC